MINPFFTTPLPRGQSCLYCRLVYGGNYDCVGCQVPINNMFGMGKSSTIGHPGYKKYPSLSDPEERGIVDTIKKEMRYAFSKDD